MSKHKKLRPRKKNIYNLDGEFGIGYTSKEEKFYFDLEDYEKIKEQTWFFDSAGYVVSSESKKWTRFHRVVMRCPDGLCVDHINGDRNDNRKENLRIVDTQKNAQNVKKIKNNRTSIYFGVYYKKDHNKYCARIQGIDGKSVFIGYYDDEKSAALAYNAKAKEFGFLTHNTIKEENE